MNIYNSSLCDFVRTLSAAVFTQLSRFFSYRLGMSETGITDIFVLELIDFNNKHKFNRNVEIYKTTWTTESIYGNDLDLFIECEEGLYTWFALQAKVMSYNGAYKDLNKYRTSKKNPQWDMLLEHEMKFNSKTYYLFYNGVPNFKPYNGTITTTDCIGTPDITELGLGIVETDIVKNIIQNNNFPTGQIYMRDFLPDKMDSIRKLFCCDINCDGSKNVYKYDDIYKGAPYQNIEYVKTKENEGDDLLAKNDKEITKEVEGIAAIRIIISKIK